MVNFSRFDYKYVQIWTKVSRFIGGGDVQLCKGNRIGPLIYIHINIFLYMPTIFSFDPISANPFTWSFWERIDLFSYILWGFDEKKKYIAILYWI